MDFYSAMKKNKTIPSAGELGRTKTVAQKDRSYMFSRVWHRGFFCFVLFNVYDTKAEEERTRLLGGKELISEGKQKTVIHGKNNKCSVFRQAWNLQFILL